MYRQITAGFLIWKMLRDLRIILSIHTAIRNICNVLVASTMDAMCPRGCHGKIKLKHFDFSVKGFAELICNSVALLYIIRSSSVSVFIVCIPILDVLVASLTSLSLPRQKISIKTLPDLHRSATDLLRTDTNRVCR